MATRLELICDGATDNRGAIQSAIDNRLPGGSITLRLCGYGIAIIGGYLSLPSQTQLIVDDSVTIKLKNAALTGTDPCWVSNADLVLGNTDISIWGGVWDGNVANQTVTHAAPWVAGTGFRFVKCSRVRIQNLTIKNPGTYAVWGVQLDTFTIENIIGATTQTHANQDGIHINGPAFNGRIQNIQGNFTDDHVALVSDESPFTPTTGDITNVVVDGVLATNGYRGVRLMSGPHFIDNVAVKNIFGTYSIEGVFFASGLLGTPDFRNISIDGVFGTFGLGRSIFNETIANGPIRITNSNATTPLTLGASGSVTNLLLNGLPYTGVVPSTTWGEPFTRHGATNDTTFVDGRLSLNHATEAYIEMRIAGNIIGYFDTSATALNFIAISGKTMDFYVDGVNPSNKMIHMDGSAGTGALVLQAQHSNQDVVLNSTGTGGVKAPGSLKVTTGTNVRAGTFTLSSGTATIGNTAITSGSVISPTMKTLSGTQGAFLMVTANPGTGFAITAYKANGSGVETADNSVYNYIVEEVV